VLYLSDMDEGMKKKMNNYSQLLLRKVGERERERGRKY